MEERDKSLIPDTLTLEGRAGIALNALIGVADEDDEYIPFFNGNFKEKPAFMTHGNWDYGSSHGRLVDAVILARYMSGDGMGADIEAHYRKNLMGFFRADGLSYRRNTFSEDIIKEHQSRFRESASMIDQRAVLLGLTTWYTATEDEKTRLAADKLCAALKRIARKERDSWYYPASEYTEDGWPSFDAVHTRLAVDPAAMWGRQVGPLLNYHIVTGNADALELAENFSANILYRSGVFHADGSFNNALGYRNGHFHTRMGTLASLASYGAYTGDASILAFVKKCYDWALTKCTSFGWTPGDLHDQAYEHETCTLADAIHTGIVLAQCGYAEYWGCVERFIRNQLTESQLLDISWIDDLEHKSMDIPGRKTFYQVGRRLRGAFSGYAAPNDFVYDGLWGRGHIMDVQTCCLGAGTRGLYLGWSNTVTERQGCVSVNLLLNRSTEWLDIKAHMPYEGRVELEVRKDIPQLLVRIPEWLPFGAVEVKLSRKGEEFCFTGRQTGWHRRVFMKLGPALGGDRYVLTFPLVRKKTVEKAATLEYMTEWAGDDVIGISPEGTYFPLYSGRKTGQRAPMKEYRLRCEAGGRYK